MDLLTQVATSHQRSIGVNQPGRFCTSREQVCREFDGVVVGPRRICISLYVAPVRFLRWKFLMSNTANDSWDLIDLSSHHSLRTLSVRCCHKQFLHIIALLCQINSHYFRRFHFSVVEELSDIPWDMLLQALSRFADSLEVIDLVVSRPLGRNSEWDGGRIRARCREVLPCTSVELLFLHRNIMGHTSTTG